MSFFSSIKICNTSRRAIIVIYVEISSIVGLSSDLVFPITRKKQLTTSIFINVVDYILDFELYASIVMEMFLPSPRHH